jgi:hypothetical protein
MMRVAKDVEDELRGEDDDEKIVSKKGVNDRVGRCFEQKSYRVRI